MKIILLGNPISTNVIYRRHKSIIYLSKEGKDLKNSYQWEAKSQFKKKPITSELEISVSLYFKDKRRRDIDNWCKILLDSLTGIVWVDDSQIRKMTIKKLMDKNNPRIELEVL